MLHIELPYDRGYPYTLVLVTEHGKEVAVLNELAAISLAARYNIPLGEKGEPGAIKAGPLGLADEVYTEPLKLSKKAQGLLKKGGVTG